MNFIHFSTYDRGGAAQAAYRFYLNLMEADNKSLFFVMYKTSHDKNVIASKKRAFSIVSKIKNRFKIKLNIYKEKYSFYNDSSSNQMDLSFYKKNIDFEPDAIVLHWVTEFVDLKVIKQLQEDYNIPVFWYLMDMAPMTGGCHYSWQCEGYKDLCQSCPAVQWPYNALPNSLMRNKKVLIDSMDIKVLAATSWLKKQLLDSTLFKDKQIYDMMLGTDDEIFRPIEKKKQEYIRKKNGIKSDHKVVFFGASRIYDERKGFLYLIKALEKLSDDNSFDKRKLVIVTAGEMANENVFSNINIQHHHIGYLDGSQELAQAYQLSDVFISPSIEDSGPMMINESIMCGTPVVAFEMGVAPDLVITGKTGYLAKLKSVDDLAYGIRQVLELGEHESVLMQQNCRKIALERTGNDIQLKTFLALMEDK